MSFCSQVAENVRLFSLTSQTPLQTAAGPAPLTTLFHSTLEGTALVEDKGVEQNQTMSLHRLQKAVDQSDSDRLLSLGLRYFNGDGVPKDIKKAFDLFQKGADLGNAGCMGELGRCYLYGKGVAKDSKKACDLFQKAGEKGDISIFYEVASNWAFTDFFGSFNERIAFHWALKGAEKGHKECIGWVAKEYYRGVVVAQDLRLSFFYFNQLNNTAAWRVLEEFYQQGIGCEQDLQLANECRKKSGFPRPSFDQALELL